MPRIIASTLFCAALLARSLTGSAAPDHVLDSLSHIYYDVKPSGIFYIVNQGVFSTIFNSRGEPLFPFRYKKIEEGLDGNFVAQGYLLIDSTGNELYRFPHEVTKIDRATHCYKRQDDTRYTTLERVDGSITHFVGRDDTKGRPLVPFSVMPGYDYSRQRFGVMDTTGREIVPAIYNAVISGTNYFSAQRGDTTCFFNRKGRLLFKCRADAAAVFKNDIMAVRLYGAWALKDSTGKTLTPYKYYELKNLDAKDMITADNTGVNRQGTEVIKASGDGPRRLPGGWIQKGYNGNVYGNNYKLIFAKGSYGQISIGERFITLSERYGSVLERTYDRSTRRFVPFSVERGLPGDTYVIRDSATGKRSMLKHNKVLPFPEFTKVEPVEHTPLYTITKEVKTGVFYKDIYGRGERPNEVINETIGLLNEKAELILPLKYSEIKVEPGSKCILATEAGKSTLFNYKGQVIAAFTEPASLTTQCPVARITCGDRTILIDSNGVLFDSRNLVSLLFVAEDKSDVWRHMPDLLAVTDSTGGTGIYDLHMHMLQPHLYHVVSEKVQGVISLKKDDSLYFINYKGRMLFNGRGFDGRNCKLLKGYAAMTRDDNGHWGVVDAAGSTVTPFVYDTMFTDPYTQLSMLGRDHKMYVLDDMGRVTQQLDSNFSKIITTKQAYFGKDGHYYKNTNGTVSDLGTDMPKELISRWILPDTRPVVNISTDREGIRKGVYNRQGRYLAPSWPNFNPHYFRFGMVICDSALTKTAIIDSTGRFRIPYIDKPTLLVVNEYSVLALYRNKSDVLYRFSADTTLTDIVNADSAIKAQMFKDYTNYSIANNTTMVCVLPGTGKIILFPSQPAFCEPGIDSVRPVGYIFAARRHGRWGLLHPASGWMYEDCDSIITNKRDNTTKLYKGSKTGAYDGDNNIFVPPLYDKVCRPTSGQHNFFVVKNEGMYKLVNKRMEDLTATFDSISDNAWILSNIQAWKNGEPYLISVTDNGVIEARPRDPLHIKKNGINGYPASRVIAQENGKYGIYSNEQFRWLLPPDFDHVDYYYESCYVALKYGNSALKRGDSSILLDEEGHLIARLAGTHRPGKLGYDLWAVRWNQAPVINSKGKTIIPGDFDDVEVEDNLLFAQKKVGGNRLKAIFTKTGIMVMPPLVEEIAQTEYYYKIGSLEKDDSTRYCLISPQGKMITAIVYESIVPNPKGYGGIDLPLFIVSKNARTGVLDAKGKELIRCRYDSILQVVDNKIVIAKNGKWGMLGTNGKVVAPFVYDQIHLMSDHKATFRKGDIYGMLDEKGKEYIDKK